MSQDPIQDASEALFRMSNVLLSDKHNELMSSIEMYVKELGRPLTEAEAYTLVREWSGAESEEAVSIFVSETAEDNEDWITPDEYPE